MLEEVIEERGWVDILNGFIIKIFNNLMKLCKGVFILFEELIFCIFFKDYI